MVRRNLFVLGMICSVWVGAGTAAAQMSCPNTPLDPWLRAYPAQSSSQYDSVPQENARLVIHDEGDALRMLVGEAIVPLSHAQAEQFSGAAAPEDRTLRPYLLRAVSANRGGRLAGVDWSGDDLIVSTGTLGCPAYVHQAVIAYLHQRPVELYVHAMTAL